MCTSFKFWLLDKEQDKSLDAKFICVDGVQLCSTIILKLASDWFAKQLAARENFKENEQIVFDYSKPGSKFTVAVVRGFLDAMHGLEISISTVPDILSMIKFIQYEGKNG